MPNPPEVCPVCGADVPRKTCACPECGACEKTGWSEHAESADLDLPDEEFNYDEFVKREFGGRKLRPQNISWLWWMVGIVLVLTFLLLFARR